MKKLSLFVGVSAGNTKPKIITYVKKDLHEVYDTLFSEALKKYNAKQNRADRIIKDYYEHIKNGEQENLFYEATIQFGFKGNAKIGTAGGERAKKMLEEYMNGFQKRNPNFVVFDAVMHLDGVAFTYKFCTCCRLSKRKKRIRKKSFVKKSLRTNELFFQKSNSNRKATVGIKRKRSNERYCKKIWI